MCVTSSQSVGDVRTQLIIRFEWLSDYQNFTVHQRPVPETSTRIFDIDEPRVIAEEQGKDQVIVYAVEVIPLSLKSSLSFTPYVVLGVLISVKPSRQCQLGTLMRRLKRSRFGISIARSRLSPFNIS